MTVKFDRAPQPNYRVDFEEASTQRADLLFPLSCALASADSLDPAVPFVRWKTILLPFLGWHGYSQPIRRPALRPEIDLTQRLAELEEWARIVEKSHNPAVEVAARRVVSAVAHRDDASDSLIDAVMAWENLVGAETELTFRVTGALAKMLERDRANRRSLRKTLVGIYGTRSRLVHGAAVDGADVAAAAKAAVDVAIRALRISYRRGPEWLGLKSNERADVLLLEEG